MEIAPLSLKLEDLRKEGLCKQVTSGAGCGSLRPGWQVKRRKERVEGQLRAREK